MGDNYSPLMGYTPFSLDEELRKKQLAQQLQSAQQPPQQPQPTTQPQTAPAQVPAKIAPNFGQPAQIPQYDPEALANIQKNLPFPKPDIPPVGPIEEAGTKYVAEAGKVIRPSDYKRNKLASVALAPFMFGDIIRNPQRGLEHFNQLTRKGYLTAEEEHARNLEQSKADYTVKQQIFRDKMTTATEGIKGNSEFIQQQIHLMDLGITTPLKIQEAAASLTKTNMEIQKLNAGDVKTDEPWHLTVNGKPMIGFPSKSIDGMSWVDAATGEKITGKIAPIGKVVDGRGSEFDQRLDTKIAQLGHTPTPEERGKLQDQVREDMQKPQEERQEKAFKEREKLAEEAAVKSEARQQRAFKSQRLKDIADGFERQIVTIEKPIALELGSLRGLRSSLSAADANGVAAQLSIVEAATAMSGGLRPISRYNLAEINKIAYSSGGWNKIMSDIQYWAQGKSGIPKETLKNLGKLADIMERELRQQQKIIGQYRTEKNKALASGNVDAVTDIGERFTDSIASAGQEEKAKAEQEKALKGMSDAELQRALDQLDKKGR